MADLLRDCKRRGMTAPVLAVGDGTVGFWKAIRDVFPDKGAALLVAQDRQRARPAPEVGAPWTRSTRPAAISARFSDRLPCERNGTSDFP